MLCLMPIFTFGQEKTVNQQSQFWWSINSSTRISERFGIIADFHHRRSDFINRTNFHFVRLGGAYWFSDELTFVAGAAHLWLSKVVDEDNLTFQDENRIYQQIQWRQAIGNVTFVQRIRNEQRWHEVLGTDGVYLRTRFSNRVRFLSSFNIRIFSNEKLPSLVISDEVHIHFGKEIVYNTFDQNRIFAGIKVPIKKQVRFDLGYMMVYQQHYTGDTYDMNHTLRWFFYYSPDLRSKKNRLHYALPGDE